MYYFKLWHICTDTYRICELKMLYTKLKNYDYVSVRLPRLPYRILDMFFLPYSLATLSLTF